MNYDRSHPTRYPTGLQIQFHHLLSEEGIANYLLGCDNTSQPLYSRPHKAISIKMD